VLIAVYLPLSAAAQVLNDGNDDDADPGRDQAIFERRGTGLMGQEFFAICSRH
jgi:hypothetical protein